VAFAILPGDSTVPIVAAAPTVADCRGDEGVWRSGGHGGIGSEGQLSVARRRSLEIRQLRGQLADWRTACPRINKRVGRLWIAGHFGVDLLSASG
jgi:hypothetical protein